MQTKRIVVVGAGPAGIMAAIRASAFSSDVTLVEKNPSLGKKLLLSGKGRSNLTNACDLQSFLAQFSGNGEFLRDAFKKFFNQDLIAFFEKRGLRLRVERQLRVFPATDRAAGVIEVLKKELLKHKVKLICGLGMKDIIIRDNSVKGVVLKDGKIITADKVILATGGVSYKFTGSSCEGIELARRLGHRITPVRPGLVPLETRQRYPLQGLALKNIRLRFSDGQKHIVSEIGELLFTHRGISGPLVLSLSGRITDWLQEKKAVRLEIDLKPALSPQQLEARLMREFKLNPAKSIKNIMQNLLPLSLCPVFLKIAGIDPLKKASYITQNERRQIILLLKALRLDIIKPLPIEEAMVTRGGVSLKDINPRSMESRLIRGLYFCCEMIDVDADTGGFNLQAAFSTGYLAGESAALN